MSPISKTTLQDLKDKYSQDPDYVEAMRELEPGYQVARMRIMMGMSQEDLAKRVGTQQPAIARLESGARPPSLAFLKRVAVAMGASVEVYLKPKEDDAYPVGANAQAPQHCNP
jgi:transcriptional regulator with XRE-family HTH domain